MTSSATQRAVARCQIYTVLALALADPPSDLLQELAGAAATGIENLDSPACGRAARSLARLQAIPRPGVTPAQRLRQATMPPGRRPVALHESLHREGRLVGPSTQAVAAYFHAVGLSVDGGELPDHAAVELSFLAALAEAEGEARSAGNHRLTARLRSLQSRFLREHAGKWLPEVGGVLAGGNDGLYAVIGRWLGEFLGEEMTPKRRSQGVQMRLPALLDALDCTLCGLCTGVCPTHALGMREQADKTRLVLVDADCISCKRCVDICPEQAMVLTSALPATNERTLRTSPRLSCPSCGRPTFSQAEMAAVLARLGEMAASVPNLDLCIPCRTAGQIQPRMTRI